jgi:hypothetical protein
MMAMGLLRNFIDFIDRAAAPGIPAKECKFLAWWSVFVGNAPVLRLPAIREPQDAEETGCIVLGLVVGVIDDTIHGSAMGSGGLHSQVRYWAQGGHIQNLVESLIDADFEVHITADHGNVAARGMGKPNVGVVAEQRGERAHVLPDESIRKAVHLSFPKSICWPSIGLPETFLPLIAQGRNAFVPETETIVCHGGVALEEVIVPYVRVTRKPS